MKQRFPKHRLVIGAYILQPYAQTEQHIKELAESGVELVVCLEPKSRDVLDLLEKYHVGCILTGVFPHWWGGDGSKAGTMHTACPISQCRELIEQFVDHPCVWGIDLGDEPSALDFDHLSDMAQVVRKKLPHLLPYLNLYPNYAAVSQNTAGEVHNQLGTDTYEEHIERYVQSVDLPYVSYDFYLYPQTKNHNVPKMLENFRIVSEACLRSGKDFWFIPQLNDRREEYAPTLNMLRYQAYLALCYGAVVINWACYTKGWWYNNVLDEMGNKTAQYEKIKEMNRELRSIGEIYTQYRMLSTHLVGFGEQISHSDFPKLCSKERFDCGWIRNLCAAGGQPLVIGQMVHRKESGKLGLFILNAADPFDESSVTAKICFETTRDNVTLHGVDFEKTLSGEGGCYSLELESNRCVMITVE